MSRGAKLSGDARMLRRASLRLGLQTAGAVAVTVAVLTAVAILVVVHGQHRQEDELLQTTIGRADDVTDPPHGVWLVLRGSGQGQVSPGLPRGLPDEDALRRTARDHLARTDDLSVAGREYRVRTQPRGAEVAQAVLDLRDAHRERSHIVRALLLAGVAGLVVAALVGAWWGRRTVTPLSEALALQQRFVADAGHELRTPLTLLSTRAQLLRRRLSREVDHAALRSDVEGLVADADRLTGILEDLLLAADPRAAAVDAPVDLHALLDGETTAARAAAQRRAVEVEFRSEARRPVVAGSEAGLRRAVNAVLDNAIRHARTRVRVHLTESGRDLVVDVLDDGPGIDPAVLPRVFERFASAARLDDGGTRRYGLGLALVSEIAARHGGTVSARNQDTGGAALTLRIPRARE